MQAVGMLILFQGNYKQLEYTYFVTIILQITYQENVCFYVCCIHSIALQTDFITESNTMDPDQTAPKAAV